MIKFFLMALVSVLGIAELATACPFCSATAQTLRQDMAAMDVVAFGELIPTGKSQPQSITKTPTEDAENLAGIAEFKIVESLRGDSIVPVGTIVSAPYYGPAKSIGRFLLMGVHQTEVLWSSPLSVTTEAEKYLRQTSRLPEDRAERLKFYLNFLENPEALLARDSYDEFAQTPYEDVKKIRDSLDHAKLIGWIKSKEVAPDRKRLYYTLLGVISDKNDASLLESLLKSQDETTRSGLDALIACYLTIVGESGLPTIDELFLKNTRASYPDTFAAVMALRFHGTEGGVIDRDKVVTSMRWMLDRPDFADLVIPDLARWEDWSQIERMAKLFRDADENSSWVRVPVVNYLRACPMPEAKATLIELEKIDPKAVKRAATFFPIPQPAAPQPATTQPATTPEGTPAPSKADADPAKSAEPATETPANKNETSIFSARPAEAQASVMRMPLGARSPVAFRTLMNRTGDSVASKSQAGSQSRIEMLTPSTQPVSPDLIMGVIPGATIARPVELCAAALLSSTTLLLFMWMILSGRPDRISTRLHRSWALAHRWTHGNPKNRVNENGGNSVQ
ncbi:MAG: hypothetical protein NTW52_19390 [Planctomycetota bacterium]|nr:hypothetical protein [Planctomycetota bacterium]